MANGDQEEFFGWRPHPWHGLASGPRPPDVVTAYIEITPFDTVKYEVDKRSGYLRVDRPQRSSSAPPSLYGFVPRTWCGPRVASLSPRSKRGDGDPLDICVLSERAIDHADILVDARVIGGLQMVDGGEADDKIIAVLENDLLLQAEDISDLPGVMTERLRHYFLTYKLIPGQEADISIEETYGRDRARAVVAAAIADYNERFGAGSPPARSST